MLLPDKHIKVGESILGLAALVASRLGEPMTFDALMRVLEEDLDSPRWPAFHTAESVSLALCFLYSIGFVDVMSGGEVYRCA